MSEQPTQPSPSPSPAAEPGRLAWPERSYQRWGWAAGVGFLLLAWLRDDFWFQFAVLCFGAFLLLHWTTERVEGRIGRKLMKVRYFSLVLMLVSAVLGVAAVFSLTR
jgi:hypothetical protein